MGSTMVAVLVEQTTVVFTAVGDSRIHVLYDGRVDQLTTDDSRGAVIRDRDPDVDESTLAAHRMRQGLPSAIGARAETEVEAGERTLSDGELVLLCADGVHGELDDLSLARIVATELDIARAAERLVDVALASSGRDNTTALLLRHTV